MKERHWFRQQTVAHPNRMAPALGHVPPGRLRSRLCRRRRPSGQASPSAKQALYSCIVMAVPGVYLSFSSTGPAKAAGRATYMPVPQIRKRQSVGSSTRALRPVVRKCFQITIQWRTIGRSRGFLAANVERGSAEHFLGLLRFPCPVSGLSMSLPWGRWRILPASQADHGIPSHQADLAAEREMAK